MLYCRNNSFVGQRGVITRRRVLRYGKPLDWSQVRSDDVNRYRLRLIDLRRFCVPITIKYEDEEEERFRIVYCEGTHPQ